MPRDGGFMSTLPRFSSLSALPREGRTMIDYDVTLAWASLMLLAIGLVTVKVVAALRTSSVPPAASTVNGFARLSVIPP